MKSALKGIGAREELEAKTDTQYTTSVIIITTHLPTSGEADKPGMKHLLACSSADVGAPRICIK